VPEAIFGFLRAILEVSHDTAIPSFREIFRCKMRWIRLGVLHESSIPDLPPRTNRDSDCHRSTALAFL
jgi:hypothetical protein